MTAVEFKVFGSAVLVSVVGSANLHRWELPLARRDAIRQLDSLAWGTAGPGVPEAVKLAGRALREQLDEIPELKPHLDGGFGAPQGARNSLMFRVVTPDVERVPFEVLFDEPTSTFAALDDRWTLARCPADSDMRPLTVTMEPTLRIMSIVAAEGEEPDRQLGALRAAVDAVDDLDVEVLVLTNRQSGIDLVGGFGPGWSAAFVPGGAEADTLVQAIAAFGPHILHLCCHGTADPPQVSIGMKDDLATLTLSAAQFGELGPAPWTMPWLVLLNCCEGGASGEDTASLASSLVSEGFPAVVGMRSPVDFAMIDLFCRELCTAVLRELESIAGIGKHVRQVDWATILQEPRRRLCTAHGAASEVAGRQKEWTMPVLYLGAHPIQARGRPTQPLPPVQLAEELTALAAADAINNAGGADVQAERLRELALNRLYGGD